jgi:hypothetical protein
MGSDKFVEFKVMINFPHLLEERIKKHNQLYNTCFELVEVIEDEVLFCVIKAEKDKLNEIFNLGYSLAVYQYSLREAGKLKW